MTEHIPGLDEVPWGDLEDVHGSAADVPELLATAFTGEEAKARSAVDELNVNVYHQGGLICSAAPALLPFLLRLAADRTRPVSVRFDALELVADLGSSGFHAAPRFVDPGWGAAWRAAVPEAADLVDDPEAAVRVAAAAVLSWERERGREMLAVLRRRWEAEPDEVTRLGLLRAAAAVVGRHPDGAALVKAAEGDVRWLLDLRDHGDTDTRMTVGFRDPLLLPGDPVGLAVAAVEEAGPRPAWLRSLYGDRFDAERAMSGALVHRVAVTLADRPGDRADLAGRLAGSPHAGARLGAVEVIAGLVGEFRGAEEEWADTVGPMLEEPWSKRRTRAVQILSVAGRAARRWADPLAARAAATRDPEERSAALFGLARLRDPRTVPLLAERAGEPCFGLPAAASHGAGWLFSPAVPDVLGPLAHEAGALVPALEAMLRGRRDSVLPALATAGEWGPAAAPLADGVAALLEDSEHPARELAVLAGIGPAAARHAPLVRRFAEAGDDGSAALAFWRITGDAEAALELARQAGPRRWNAYWTLLAELGASAAPLLDAVRGEAERGNPLAALALWRTTGDAEAVLRSLLDGADAPLGGGVHSWAGPVAVRAVREMGGAAAPALPRLRELRDARRRPGAGRTGSGSGWRDVARDRELLALLDTALARIGG